MYHYKEIFEKIIHIIKTHKWIVLISLIFVITTFILTVTIMQLLPSHTNKLDETVSTQSSFSEIITEKQMKELYVDIKGEVHKPGVYAVSTGDRIKDVIDRAGGLTEKANSLQINFAQLVNDEMVIVIPSVDSPSDMNMISIHQEKRINLNTATKEELMTIKGIGEKKAELIISYRKQQMFRTIDDLKNIKGFSDKFIEDISGSVMIQ